MPIKWLLQPIIIGNVEKEKSIVKHNAAEIWQTIKASVRSFFNLVFFFLIHFASNTSERQRQWRQQRQMNGTEIEINDRIDFIY